MTSQETAFKGELEMNSEVQITDISQANSTSKISTKI